MARSARGSRTGGIAPFAPLGDNKKRAHKAAAIGAAAVEAVHIAGRREVKMRAKCRDGAT